MLWSEKEGIHPEWTGTDGYLGTYGNCVVVFYPGMMAVNSGIRVADYLFEYETSFSIYVFTNDQMMTIRDAYECGILTYEQIDIIYAVYEAKK